MPTPELVQHSVTMARPGGTAGRSWRHTRGSRGASRPWAGTVTTETLQRRLQGTQAFFSPLPAVSLARPKEKTGNMGPHDCGLCSQPCGQRAGGTGVPQLRAARTDCFSMSFIGCTCKWTHHAAAPRTPRLKGRRGENAALRPTSRALPTLDPAGGILGTPRSAGGGGQAAPERQDPSRCPEHRHCASGLGEAPLQTEEQGPGRPATSLRPHSGPAAGSTLDLFLILSVFPPSVLTFPLHV